MMVRFILAGAALAIAAAVPAAADEALPQGSVVVAQNDQHKDEHKQTGQPGGGQQGQPKGNSHPEMRTVPSGQMGGPNRNGNMTGGGMMGTQHNAPNGNMMMGQHGTPNRNFDRRSFQRNVSASRHFHINAYVRPEGWYYRRWGYGQILPALFWSQNYWIGDYYDYGLPDPPPGFVWVRYGDDALLVDQNSGEILQVDYGLFD